jgi:signal transduction histidine kinase
MQGGWGTRETILVVDDDRNVCLALERQLVRAGYLVHTVGSGAQALEFAVAGRIDLVILDLFMPGMNGIQTCLRLRATPGWEHTPILILTGADDEALYAQAVDSGADDFLTKPVRNEELLLRVRSLIRIQALVADLRDAVTAAAAQREVIQRNAESREKLEAFLLHDLKNPIGNALMLAEVMLEPGTSFQAPDAWGKVLDSMQRLRTMVMAWMDNIRAERSGLAPNLVAVEIEPFLARIVAHNETWLQLRHLTTRLELAPPGLTQPMDPALMERVLVNLMDNCIRYSPEGGEIRLGATRGDPGLILEVSDQGPGVPEAFRESIFELYAQLEPAAARTQNRYNRGMGMAFCKTAVESHGGRIRVADNPGGGARFVIELP